MRNQRMMMLVVVVAATWLPTAMLAQATTPPRPWTMPRTPEGRPDLQGNWSNATLTPLERPTGLDLVLTKEQVARFEKVRSDTVEKLSKSSDPNRPAPPVGGDGSTGAAGNVGGYNYFWIDAGDRIMMVNGEPRSSIVVDPPNGRIPPLTDAARARQADRTRLASRFGQYDNPENRPLAERCIVSFGSNAGPPMLPNYFYNNNYTIVQTQDHVMIMTEMVHESRRVYLDGRAAPPPEVTDYLGYSRGRWEGDTLVIETTNFTPGIGNGPTPNSAQMKVTERITPLGPNQMRYEAWVEDPVMLTTPYKIDIPWQRNPNYQFFEYACHEGNVQIRGYITSTSPRFEALRQARFDAEGQGEQASGPGGAP